MPAGPGADAGRPRERLLAHPLLRPLPAADREALLDAVRLRTWPAGAHVLREGDASDALYLVLDGTVRITVRAAEKDVELARLGVDAVFGEEGLLRKGPRSATVTALTPLTCAEIPQGAFDRHLAPGHAARRRMEKLSAERLAERLTRSVAALRGLDLGGTGLADVQRVQYDAGRTILARGDPSDAVLFVLRGVAVAVDDTSDRPVELSRTGPGQCVGELGVMRGRARSATVVAETDVRALRVEAARFRTWVQDNPMLADHLGTLERIYPLASGGTLSVYRTKHDGRPAVTTLAGDPSGDCVLSTKVLDADLVVLARGESIPQGEVDAVTFAEPGRVRRLALDDVRRDARGRPTSGRLRGVEVQGTGPDVARLYGALRDREVLPRRTLQRFRRTGFLGGETSDPDRICHCLEVGRTDVLAAGPDVASVVAALGVGSVCGACLPTVEHALRAPASDAHERTRAQPVARRSTLVPRRPDVRFDVQALRALRAEPELHATAVASVFAAVGERFMIRRIGRALPTLEDPRLAADAEAFLAQESLHVEAHAPLNHLFLDVLYPACGALRRASRRMPGAVERLPRLPGLAVCAAFEHAADGAFDLFLARYYDEGRRFSADERLHTLVARSGAGPLLLWHGAEELGHRHVAADVLRAAGGGLLARAFGLAVLGLQAAMLLLPALGALRVVASGKRGDRGAHRPTSTLRVVAHTARHALRFLLPGFHPPDVALPYAEALRRDLAEIPEA